MGALRSLPTKLQRLNRMLIKIVRVAVITAFATFKKSYKDMKKFIIGIDFSKETVDASIVQKEL